MNCGLVDPLCYKDNFVRFLKMTCNLVNIWSKTCRKETQYLNCYSFGILNTSGTSKVFLKKCYVKNLTYINFICKCIAGFSLLLTDWKFKHGKPRKSIFDVVLSSVQRKPPVGPHEAFIVNFDKYLIILWKDIFYLYNQDHILIEQARNFV